MSGCDQVNERRTCKAVQKIQVEHLETRNKLRNLEFIISRILRKNPELIQLALMEDL